MSPTQELSTHESNYKSFVDLSSYKAIVSGGNMLNKIKLFSRLKQYCIASFTIVCFISVAANIPNLQSQYFYDLYSCGCSLPTQYRSEFYYYYHYYQHPYWGWGFQSEPGYRYWTSQVYIVYFVLADPTGTYFPCHDGHILFWSAQANGSSYFYGQHTYGPQQIFTGTEFNYTSGGGSPIGTYPSFASCNPNGW